MHYFSKQNMELFKIIFTPILPLIGVAIGASLQYIFSKSSETRKQLSSLRTQAYIDYINCVAESSKVKKDQKKLNDLLARAADAKTRIATYGSSQVIIALSAFEKGKPVIDSLEAANRLLKLVEVIRLENVGKKDIVEIGELRMILFGDREW